MSNLPWNSPDGKPLDGEKLDPNKPEVYTNPDLIKLLDPVDQTVAFINLAQTGQLVEGDTTRTLEAILAGAGYPMVIDGQWSAEEEVALKQYKDKLNDTAFKDEAMSLLKMIAGVEEEGAKIQLFDMSEPFIKSLVMPKSTPIEGVSRSRILGQKLIADPTD